MKQPLPIAMWCVLTASLLLSACGVPLQTAPAPIPASALPRPAPMPSSPAPSFSATAPAPTSSSTQTDLIRIRLWFVEDDGLAPVELERPGAPDPGDLLRELGEPPTSSALRTIARDPLSGESMITVSEASAASVPAAPSGSGPLILQVSESFSALPPAEQVLLLGQVVLTLAGAGWSAITFTDASGAELAVPLPDGRLLDVPATARDYAPLIIRP